MSQIPDKSDKSNSSEPQMDTQSTTNTESAFNAEDNANYAPLDFLMSIFDPEPKTAGCANCKHVTYQLDADLQLAPAKPPTEQIAMGIAQGRRRLTLCMNCGHWKINK